MTDWRTVGLGAGGTLATFGLEHFNTLIACLCGLLTLALLSRKVFWSFLADWRAFKSGPSIVPPDEKEPAERGRDGSE